MKVLEVPSECKTIGASSKHLIMIIKKYISVITSTEKQNEIIEQFVIRNTENNNKIIKNKKK